MKWHLLVLALVLCVIPSCDAPAPGQGGASETPIAKVVWLGKGDGFQEWGRSSDGLFGLSGEPAVLETWKWDGADIRKDHVAQTPRLSEVVVLPESRCLATESPINMRSPWPLVLLSLSLDKVIMRWEPPEHWFYDKLAGARSGQFAAVMLSEDLTNPPADSDWEVLRVRLGLIDFSNLQMSLAELTIPRTGSICNLAVSDDGKYVALAGCDNSVVMVDVSIGKVIWEQRPPQLASLDYAVFSSDGSQVFAAGDWGVFALQTATGKVMSQFVATPTGRALYGHRISCLAVSPDDQWVAAGTGPNGTVYLFSTAGKAKPRSLPHGLITTLAVSFSPDSKYLASMAGGMIKVWRIK